LEVIVEVQRISETSSRNPARSAPKPSERAASASTSRNDTVRSCGVVSTLMVTKLVPSHTSPSVIVPPVSMSTVYM
jgi:hypothetical protein